MLRSGLAASAEFMKIAPATLDDLPQIRSLLIRSGLPVDGVDDFIHGFVVAMDEKGQVLACAGIEQHNDLGLLRSVAVDESLRGSGLGKEIVAAAFAKARDLRVQELILLTTTAKDFFAKHFAFVEVARSSYDKSFALSPEWGLTSCSTAVVMSRKLDE
jgi:amino-acid N-acetyltransferase